MTRFSFAQFDWFSTTGQAILVGIIWSIISFIISLKVSIISPVTYRGAFSVIDHLIGWGASLLFIPLAVYTIGKGLLKGYWVVSLIVTISIAVAMSYGWNVATTNEVVLPADQSKEMAILGSESHQWQNKKAHFVQSNTFDLFTSLLLIIGISFVVGALQLVQLRERSEAKIKERLYELKSRLSKNQKIDEVTQNEPLGKISIKMGSKTYFVSIKEIAYISAAGNYLELYDLENKHVLRETMSGMLTRLPNQFIRIHKSSIINTEFIEALVSIGYGDYELKMRNGRQMRISDSYKQAVLQQLKQGHAN